MKLTSQCERRIYWRTFTPTDELHVAGLNDGFLNRNQTAHIEENGVGFQLEIKEGGLLAALSQALTEASTSIIYTKEQDLVINARGQLIKA